MTTLRPREFKMPPDYRFAYHFKGVIHPVRANVELYDLGISRIKAVTASKTIDGYLELVGKNGEFEVLVHTAFEIEDLYTFKNIIRTHVEARIDLLCLYFGAYYDAEVISCVPPSGEEITFGVQLRAMKELSDQYLKRVSPDKLISHPCFRYLSTALKDFKIAMKDPLESYFSVYRAIETIRVYYANINNIDPDDAKNSWALLRSSLGYMQSDFDLILENAKARRHGEVRLTTEEETVECLKFGWNFLNKFIEVTFGADCKVQ